jgi:hypothetical protein
MAKYKSFDELEVIANNNHNTYVDSNINENIDNVILSFNDNDVLTIETNTSIKVQEKNIEILNKENNFNGYDISCFINNYKGGYNSSSEYFNELTIPIEEKVKLEPCLYNGKLYILGISHLDYSAYDFNIDYDYTITLIDYEKYKIFFSEENILKRDLFYKKEKLKKEENNKKKEIVRNKIDKYIKDNSIIFFETKKELTNLRLHYCYYYSSLQPSEIILDYLKIHHNNVKRMSKLLTKVIYSKKQIDDYLEFKLKFLPNIYQ